MSRIAYNRETGQFIHGGIVYFEVSIEVDRIEEDYKTATDIDEDDDERLAAEASLREAGLLGLWNTCSSDLAHALLALETKAMAEVCKALGLSYVSNEGHGSDGSLICKFSVSNYHDVVRLSNYINDNYIGGQDAVGIDTPYTWVCDFRLYPDDSFTAGTSWGEANGLTGTIEEWIEANKPALPDGTSRATASE